MRPPCTPIIPLTLSPLHEQRRCAESHEVSHKSLNTRSDVVQFRATREGFVVIGQKEGLRWSTADAEEFYEGRRDKGSFRELVAFMCSGPIVQICLEKVLRRSDNHRLI